LSDADIEKQEEMRRWYDEGDYFDGKVDVFANLRSPFQRYRLAKVLQIYTPKKDERVLDLGCGWGTFTFALAPICKEIVGLDYSAKSIELCEKLATESGLDKIRFICADASNTGFPESSYDIVIAADLFEHLYPEVSAQTIREAYRILAPSGKFSIWTPYRGHIIEILKNRDIIFKHDPSHVDYKSMDWLIEQLTTAGFAIRKKYYVESHIPIFRTLERITLPFFSIMRRRIAILAEKIC